jgi:aldehyde dehydrogenase (NAD+)
MEVDVTRAFLARLGIEEENSGACTGSWIATSGEPVVSLNPTDEQAIASVRRASLAEYDQVVQAAQARFRDWRNVPAPRRGEIVRQLGTLLRENKKDLGQLISLEMGKIASEGEGEVQEMIDIADFAVGLSRQLYGLSMHSERPGHRMYEQWHPLGSVGIITAFNFPGAVWAWNAAIAAICGDTMIWKPSHQTPLTSLAIQKLCNRVMEDNGVPGVFNLIVGDGRVVGEAMLADRRLPLVSATGSCRMGRRVAEVVAQRFGRSILELGGNNAIIILDDADLDLALRAVLFGAVGTAGQRCTSTRRLFLQRGIADRFVERLTSAYESVRIGDPLDAETLMGPLVNAQAIDDMMAALERARAEGAEVVYGGNRIDRPGYFVEPTIVRAQKHLDVARDETFAPVLYVFPVDSLDEAIEAQNSVDQGLSSAIFTTNLLAAETFLSAKGSDCGIANVNIGTSGAEIGGAFGGEKDTGGGREAGSDSWKLYMRRQTNTVNWSCDMPLAQGVHFDVD